ncbi:acyl-CoA synthetase [Mycolicibacterium komossense]|uniref:Acyl-CoA synthetase n=1 Tax=Mycolicibacterium komossense TaxID=1779 RepID=A0ABT3CKR4_9MYCO|nr:acyl-CoA synthetase [Mycolicibacterium komossense]MCV7230002.1 acyl-CoA synthetase [Mycolicibacterium komossense]
MYPGAHISTSPDKPAVTLVDTGVTLTYAQLEERSTRLSNAFRDAGLAPGDVVALLSTNDVRVFEVYWACLRTGLYLTPVNFHLTAAEAGYILADCGASALVVSADLAELARGAVAEVPQLTKRFAYGGEVAGFRAYEALVASGSPEAPADQPRGADMLYSSGTTGRPKGIKPLLPQRQVGSPGDPYVGAFGTTYEMNADTVYFSPAPLYHAAPLRFGMIVQALGGTVLISRGFDAAQCLRVIDDFSVTHSQWVPTHFVRMLRLPEEIRQAYDLSSQRYVIHAAAPCPVEVKHQMVEWFGPVLHEYYSSTEANGITMISTAEWLARPGSVGTATLGVLHICTDDGQEVPPGEPGLVYFERDEMPFAYHRDPEKTAAARHPSHPTWSTCGDIGHLDSDGYLYLRDRQAFTIISGGVNIYPQEIEDCLTLHPAVFDVAVLGVPDADFGESVLAAIQLNPNEPADDSTRGALLAYLRPRIAGYKMPRRIEFVQCLPRSAAGKLTKGALRQQFSSVERTSS